jgi:putative alpha-1,2-mannosidase
LQRFIQSATLDGKSITRTWLTSSKLHAGGRLSYVMGAQPNKSWGTGADDAPPGI